MSLGITEIVVGSIVTLPSFRKFIDDLIKLSVGDFTSYYQKEKLLDRHINFIKKVKEKCSDLNPETMRYLSDKIGIPLLQNALLEDDDSLQEKWSNMLRNASDPNFEHDITKNYVSILSDMNPSCARILDYIGKKCNEAVETDINFNKTDIESDLGIKSKECLLSILNLERLGCLKYNITRSLLPLKPNLKSDPTPSFDIERVSMTELGLDFYASVN